jgi:hypothetical protein
VRILRQKREAFRAAASSAVKAAQAPSRTLSDSPRTLWRTGRSFQTSIEQADRGAASSNRSEKMPDAEVEKKDAEAPETANTLRVAKVGVKDTGEVVSTFGGEPIEGIVADIADGD